MLCEACARRCRPSCVARCPALRSAAEALIRQGVNDTEIARRLPVLRQTVLTWRHKLEAQGIVSEQRRKWQEHLELSARVRARRRQRETETCEVYFMMDPARGWLKIGYSSNVAARLKDFRTANPAIRLLATIPGGFRLEQELHVRFASLLVELEWFRYEGPLMAYVEALLPHHAAA